MRTPNHTSQSCTFESFKHAGESFMSKRKTAIVTGSVAATVGLGLTGVGVFADEVIADDTVLKGSLCVGIDCQNNESFGYDTIRLKENNLRIRFVDTSNSGSFPTNDWQITVNDSTNGGLNKFSIDDLDGGSTPFTIEAGAGTDSLRVDDAGRVGLGTANPATQAHVVDGNSPTLRLDQDGSQGFQPQAWDLGSNETNFFVRDATTGGTLPFKIQPGAPTDALVVESSGTVSLGDGSLVLRDDVSGIDWNLEATSTGGFTLSRDDGGTVTTTLTILPSGDVEITGDVSVDGSISCTAGNTINGDACS
ncbi:hypothetical protein YM304_00540 [Ilumatobacter coccineus YM16-304]|uniref:Uncharacterized protein n=2 Tax=Ilumatobacter coccineus TaxID=467094 RepID=A0A6C7E6X6_ILUCY|nr:hypothetical protein YM304_00540 [Ilumatobacter coccineus YM16-304]